MFSISGQRIKKVSLALLLTGTMLVPAACSQIADPFRGTPPEVDNTVRQQALPDSNVEPVVSNLASRNSQSGQRVASGSLATPVTQVERQPPRSAPSLSPSSSMAKPKGLVDNRRLFETPISDPIERIRRIEVAVQDLRNDFDTAIPAMAGLVVSESELSQVLEDLKRAGDLSYSDIAPPKSSQRPRQPLEPKGQFMPNPVVKGAIGAPQKMVETPAIDSAKTQHIQVKPTSSSIEKTPAPKKIAPKVAAAKPTAQPTEQKAKTMTPKSMSGTHVLNVRVGSYPDKTRIVLDVSQPASYNIDLDNNEKLLVMEISGAKWAARESFTFKDSPLLEAFSAQSDANGGSRLLLSLKKPVKILKKFALKKDGPRKDRIVLDIAQDK